MLLFRTQVVCSLLRACLMSWKGFPEGWEQNLTSASKSLLSVAYRELGIPGSHSVLLYFTINWEGIMWDAVNTSMTNISLWNRLMTLVNFSWLSNILKYLPDWRSSYNAKYFHYVTQNTGEMLSVLGYRTPIWSHTQNVRPCRGLRKGLFQVAHFNEQVEVPLGRASCPKSQNKPVLWASFSSVMSFPLCKKSFKCFKCSETKEMMNKCEGQAVRHNLSFYFLRTYL